jgi:uncharacterized protein DUF6130
MRKVGAFIALLAMALFAVGSASAAAPLLDIQSPTDGLTIHGGLVVVKYDVKDFKIVDFTKDPAVSETQGHIHIQLDQNPVNTIHTISNVWVFAGVKPGEHTLRVWLVHSDHSPLKDKVEKSIRFTVAAK